MDRSQSMRAPGAGVAGGAVAEVRCTSPREPWRRKLTRTLLYGNNVDRPVKTRARIGLVILVFALGYSVIAARLVMFAATPEGHGTRRAAVSEATATARPDILDRNGEVL